MAATEFFFTLDVSARPAPVALVIELTTHVLRDVGAGHDAAPDLVDGLAAAIARVTAGGNGRVDVRFRAHGCELEIVVSSGSGRVWRTARPIPEPLIPGPSSRSLTPDPRSPTPDP